MTDITGIALAQAVQSSTSLKSFNLSSCGNMSEATGIAVSQAVQSSTSLESFFFGCCGSRMMSDATGTALAKTVQSRTSLQSFKLDCSQSIMGDATGIALAQAVRSSTSLQSLQLICSDSSVTEATGTALAQAVQRSFSIVKFDGPVDDGSILPFLERNRSLPSHWRNIALLAWRSETPSLRRVAEILGEGTFARMLYAFFLPLGWRASPVDAVNLAPRRVSGRKRPRAAFLIGKSRLTNDRRV